MLPNFVTVGLESFYIGTEAMSRPTSKVYCQSLGAHLVDIGSPAKYYLILNWLISSKNFNRFIKVVLKVNSLCVICRPIMRIKSFNINYETFDLLIPQTQLRATYGHQA